MRRGVEPLAPDEVEREETGTTILFPISVSAPSRGTSATTPFGVLISERSPKVAPKPSGNLGLEDAIPLGLVAPERDLISSRRDASSCRPRIPTGFRRKAQGLRATSYPGSASLKYGQPQRGCGESAARLVRPRWGRAVMGRLSWVCTHGYSYSSPLGTDRGGRWFSAFPTHKKQKRGWREPASLNISRFLDAPPNGRARCCFPRGLSNPFRPCLDHGRRRLGPVFPFPALR